MRNAERYPFLSGDSTLGEASFRPYLLFTLLHQQVSVPASALLDTGASVNTLRGSGRMKAVGDEFRLICRRCTSPLAPEIYLETCRC